MIRSSFMAIPEGGLYDAAPPDGPPTSVGRFFYGEESNPLVGVAWVNGDPDAWTQIGFGASDPTAPWDAVPPGITSYSSGIALTVGEAIWVRHTRGGVNTVWVQG